LQQNGWTIITALKENISIALSCRKLYEDSTI
jgi:hypothetical protein